MTEQAAIGWRVFVGKRGLAIWSVTFATVTLRLFLAEVVGLKLPVLVVDRKSGCSFVRGLVQHQQQGEADEDEGSIENDVSLFHTDVPANNEWGVSCAAQLFNKVGSPRLIVWVCWKLLCFYRCAELI